MSMHKTEMRFTLGIDDLEAIITLERAGQQNIDVGDEVIVRGKIYLPSYEESGNYLHKSIEFESRVMMFNENLHGSWGIKKNKCRRVVRNFYGKFWSTTFAEAEKACMAELQKLLDALATRKQALADAEKPAAPLDQCGENVRRDGWVARMGGGIYVYETRATARAGKITDKIGENGRTK